MMRMRRTLLLIGSKSFDGQLSQDQTLVTYVNAVSQEMETLTLFEMVNLPQIGS